MDPSKEEAYKAAVDEAKKAYEKAMKEAADENERAMKEADAAYQKFNEKRLAAFDDIDVPEHARRVFVEQMRVACLEASQILEETADDWYNARINEAFQTFRAAIAAAQEVLGEVRHEDFEPDDA